MADLPGVNEKVTVEETSADQPVSEALAQKIGSSLNNMIDVTTMKSVTFSAGGTWVVPVGVRRIFVFACGGGGGGGGSKTGRTGGSPIYRGDGGDGAIPVLQLLTVEPGTEFTIIIGAGGIGGVGSPATSADGGNGGNGGTTILLSSETTLTFYGASGGKGSAVLLDKYRRRSGLPYSHGGEPGQDGGGSLWALGGTSGANLGGGGGASLGNGGRSSGPPGTQHGGIGAGGGGGALASPTNNGHSGGNGGPGYMVIYY